MIDMTSPRAVGVARACVGLVQGLGLYAIYLAYDEKGWPATSGLVFAPLLLIFLYVPLLLSQGLSSLRRRTLLLWIVAATLIIGVLGFYDNWHAWPFDFDYGQGAARPHLVPDVRLFFALTGGLFIAQALILGGDEDRKFIASYPTHFDAAWKLAVQGVLAAAFTGVFWGVLLLGAQLFELIKLDFLRRLIEHRWFAIPATTIAFALAIHMTDVRAGIVRGIRTLGLALLSWLLPLMTLITAGFLSALIFTGLQPLWDTRFATVVLLAAEGALVALINATYQNGDKERVNPRVLTYPGSLASLVLVPLALLAGYALVLRVRQYGWTADRIYAAAGVSVAICYAMGYASAALWRGPWLKRIERWNFYTALVVLAVLVALFTPIADPYRISVASQIARLDRGAVSPQQFDFSNLRWEGGRYGQEALNRLRARNVGADVAYIRDSAVKALQATNRLADIPPVDFAGVTMRTQGAQLPASFVNQNWSEASLDFEIAGCLRKGQLRCDAWIKDLDNDRKDDVLLVEGGNVTAYGETAEGWRLMSSWRIPANCRIVREALIAGQFTFAAPQRPQLPDIEILGLRMAGILPFKRVPCPQ